MLLCYLHILIIQELLTMHFLSRDISTRWPWLWCQPVCVKKQHQCNCELQSPGKDLHTMHTTIHHYRSKHALHMFMAREWL